MDIKKLQTLVVDALEDVKAQEIRVFDTTHLTSLFDRVAIASGTSNRQTKALAASVRDKVKSKGGNVVSVEGEDTGEWVLVDLGDMIVHIMQPAIRTYYRLEEIWGDKEVKMGAAKRTGTSAVAKREAADAPAPKIRRTRAQAEAVEASQALDDDDEVKKPVRKPRTTTAATGAAGTGTKTTRTASTRAARTAAGRAETGAKAAAPRTTRAAAGTTRTTTGSKTGTTRTTTGTKTGTTRTTTGTKTGVAKTATTRSKTAAPKTAVGKTVRVAPSKSASAKKPASKRVSKA